MQWPPITVMYGGPPIPTAPTPTPNVPFQIPGVPVVQPYPFVTAPDAGSVKLDIRTQAALGEDTQRRLRVTTLHTDTGEIRIKVYIDGVLISESIAEGGSTLTVETNI